MHILAVHTYQRTMQNVSNIHWNKTVSTPQRTYMYLETKTVNYTYT